MDCDHTNRAEISQKKDLASTKKHRILGQVNRLAIAISAIIAARIA
jgi:hypothetical protein